MLEFQAHHDGSPAYLADEQPVLGSHVAVRVRTTRRQLPERIWVRTVRDGEPFFDPMTIESEDDHLVWWRGEVLVRNPVTNYRFMLATGETHSWLNAAGVVEHDVPDAFDFTVNVHRPAPDWGRDAVVYQIFPDRFGRSAQADARPTPAWAVPAAWDDAPIHEGPQTSLQFYGGDLDGIREHLDQVAAVGADTVYLTPCFPAESNHRYNASTFERIDPLVGGDEAMVRLSDALHDRGWRLLGDLTSNHTGDTHEWFVRAHTDPGSAERGYYYFGSDGAYESWKGVSTLPKLDHTDAGLATRMITGPDAPVRYWLRPPFSYDGWRVDVANMTGRNLRTDVAHRVARRIRRAATQERPDALVLAEHGHDASGDLDGDGWHGTMNYFGFSFPVWEFVRKPDGHVPSFGLPVGIPRRTAAQAFTGMREFTARFGWRAVGASWNILGSHDSPRIRTTCGSAALQRVAVVLQFTLPGVPMVFAGDEIGLEGVDGEDSRRTMPWDSMPSDSLTEHYAGLARLRRERVCLRRGGLRWVHLGDDLVAYVREHPAGSLLVAVSRGGSPEVALDAGALGVRSGAALLGDVGFDGAIPAAAEPTAWVWEL